MTEILEMGTEVMINNRPLIRNGKVEMCKDEVGSIGTIVDYDDRDQCYTIDLGYREIYFTRNDLDLV